MWIGFSMMIDHHWSGWAWLWLTPLIVFGVIIYAADRSNGADVEVGENICFPVHWCIPGTTGESAIDADGNVEVGENRCFPAHWCIPGTASGDLNRARPDFWRPTIGRAVQARSAIVVVDDKTR